MSNVVEVRVIQASTPVFSWLPANLTYGQPVRPTQLDAAAALDFGPFHKQ